MVGLGNMFGMVGFRVEEFDFTRKASEDVWHKRYEEKKIR